MEIAAAVGMFFKAVASAAAAKVASVAFAITGSSAVGIAVSNFVAGALSFGAVGGGAWAAIGANVAQAAALSLLTRSMAGKPNLPSPEQQITFTPDPNAPREMLFGLAPTAGTPIMATTHGSGRFNNALLTYIVPISSMGPIDGVEAIYLNDELATFNGNGNGAIIPGGSGANHLLPGRLTNTQWKDWVYYQHRLGEWNQSAIQFTASPGELPEWTSAHRGAGVAHYAISYWINPDLFSGGAPTPKIVARGFKNLINPVDLNVGYSAYPADVVYTLLQKIESPNDSSIFVGAGLPPEWIDRPSYAAWRQQNVANNYTMGGVYRITQDNLWEFLKACFEAGAATYCNRDGKASVAFEAVKPVVYTLTEKDLNGAPVEEPFPDRKTRVNRYVPRCWSPANKWEFVDVEAVENTSYLTQDRGRRLTATWDLNLVHNPSQARQICAYGLVKGRQPILTLPCKPHMAGLSVDSVIAVDLDDEYGISWARAVVLANDCTASDGGTIRVRFEPPGYHEYALGFTATDEPLPTIPLDPASTVPSPVGAATASAAVLESPGGRREPVIRCSAALPEGTVASCEFRVKPASSLVWETSGSVLASGTSIDVGPVRGSTLYNVEARFVLASGVVGAWAPLPSVTTAQDTAGVTAPQPANLLPGGGPLVVPGRPGAGWLGEPGERWEIVESNAALYGLAMWKRDLDGAVWDDINSPSMIVSPGEQLSAVVTLGRFGTWASGDVGAAIAFFDANGAAIGTPTIIGWALDGQLVEPNVYEVKAQGLVAPVGAVTMRFTVGVSNGSGSGYAAFWRAKVNRGPIAFPWSDEATTGRLWEARIGDNVLTPDGNIATPSEVLNTFVPRIEGVRTIVVESSWNGMALPGQLPKTTALRRMEGDEDVSVSTAWSLAAVNATASISNGQLTVTAVNGNGTITVTATRNGVPLTHEIAVYRNLAAPPVTGGGGARVAVDTTIETVWLDTLTTCAGPLTVRATAAGRIEAMAALTYTANDIRDTALSGRIRYRALPSGSWTWAGPEVVAADPARTAPEESIGYIEVYNLVTGLTDGIDYEFELMLRRSAGTGTSYPVGNFSVESK